MKPGKKPCQNAWVTGLVPTSGNIAQPVRAARARWKIENAITVLTLKGDAFARGPAATSRLREGLEAAGAAVCSTPRSRVSEGGCPERATAHGTAGASLERGEDAAVAGAAAGDRGHAGADEYEYPGLTVTTGTPEAASGSRRPDRNAVQPAVAEPYPSSPPVRVRRRTR